MRLVAGLLALTLFAPFVRAEDTAAPPTPAAAASEPARGRAALRVIRIMPESHQALLFDRGRATYVLAEVGAKIGDYVVDDIDAEEVTLSRGSTQLVLAAPATDSDHRGAPQAAPAVRAPDSARSDATPVDPYGDEVRSVSASAPAAEAPRAPGAGGVRVASAPDAAADRPIAPGDDGVRVASAPNIPDEPPRAAAAPATSPAPSVAPALPVARPTETPSATPPPWSSSAEIPQASGGLPIAGPSTTLAPPPPAAGPSAAPLAAAVSPTAAAASPTAAAVSPTAAAASPSVAAASPTATAPSPAAAASPPAAAPLSAPTSTKAAAASPRRPAKKAPARTAGNRQTLDALAMADMMSGDSPRRGPRGPAIEVPTDDDRAASSTAAGSPAPAASPTPASSGSRTSAPAAPADAIVLSRGEVDGALGDFASLSTAIQASFSPAGVVVEHLAENTIFERAGLLPGDTITSINGMRLRSLDDAADLYARAATASTLTVQLVRSGRPVTLRIAIQ